MKTTYYNIHDLVAIRLCKNNKNASYFDRRLKHFKSQKFHSSDIDVYFNVLPAGTTKSYLKDLFNRGTVFCDNSARKLAKWEVYIKYVEGSKTEIFFFGNMFSCKYLFFYFLEPIINHVLTCKGFCLAHASCFSLGNVGYLINAYPASGKTSILLRMLKNGANYLADEMTIISKDGFAYSYPTSISLSDYNINRYLLNKIGVLNSIKISIFRMIRKLSRGRVKFAIEIDAAKLMMGGKLVKVCKVEISYLISKPLSLNQSMEHIEKEMLEINRFQYRYFDKFIENSAESVNLPKLEKYWRNVAEVTEGFCCNVENIVIANEGEFDCHIKSFLRKT